MLKLIIVDDEPHVVQLINSLIEWESIGILNAGVADNGLTAFEMIKSINPDIVITDIRMPGSNGIELVRKVRESGYKTRFILISGHKEFDYAQNAVHFGVDEYLLKPINKKELNDILTALRDKILEERGEIENKRLIENQLERNREKLQSAFIQRVIHQPSLVDRLDREKLRAEYQLDFRAQNFTAFSVIIDQNDFGGAGLNLSKITTKLSQIIKQACKGKDSQVALSAEDSRIICIANYLDQNEFNTLIDSSWNEIQKVLEKYQSIEITVGIGSSETEVRHLGRSIKKALDALTARAKVGTNTTINSSNLHFELAPAHKFLDIQWEADFSHSIEALDLKTVEVLINRVFDEMDAYPNLHPTLYLEIGHQIWELFRHQMQHLGSVPQLEIGELQMSVERFRSISNLKGVLINRVAQVLDVYINYKKVQDAKPIRVAKKFIQSNFENQISLEDVAQEVHLTPAYLSSIFKKETGINFSDYLTNCRIDQAKHYLKNSQFTNDEIGKLVGYRDVKYFYRLFKKRVGITPGEYRKLYS